MPEFLKKADVARLLNVSPRTLDRWARSGRLPPPVRLSDRTLRFRRSDIQKYLDDQTLPGPAPAAPDAN
jgi:excisionase family DNA binding protein